MTTCALKETFIEKLLDEFQPKWREGEDITAETKELIRARVEDKLPNELKDGIVCISDFSIWNMAQKIRKREGLPLPKKTNKGNQANHEKVSSAKPSDANHEQANHEQSKQQTEQLEQ